MTKIPDAVSKVHPNHPVLGHRIACLHDTITKIDNHIFAVANDDNCSKFQRAAYLKDALAKIDELTTQVNDIRTSILDLYGK
jgi:hypothetical protein